MGDVTAGESAPFYGKQPLDDVPGEEFLQNPRDAAGCKIRVSLLLIRVLPWAGSRDFGADVAKNSDYSLKKRSVDNGGVSIGREWSGIEL